MTGLIGVLGLLLVLVIMTDALWTTLSTTGGGPLSSRLAQALWTLIHSL